ncbi:MAG: hypothetical protein WKF94_01670 [Solirubrobacteraceae bacterium]
MLEGGDTIRGCESPEPPLDQCVSCQRACRHRDCRCIGEHDRRGFVEQRLDLRGRRVEFQGSPIEVVDRDMGVADDLGDGFDATKRIEVIRQG